MGSAEEIVGIGASFYMDPAVAEAYTARPGYPAEAIEHLLGSTALDLNDGRVLDAACGTGQIARGLIDAEIKGRIIAMDQSESMLRAMPEAIQSRVTRVVGDLNGMPLPDDTVDVAIFGTAIHWGNYTLMPDELHRVVRPAGFVASVNNTTRIGTEFTAILDEIPDHAARVNPITADPESLNLRGRFDFVGSRKFENDVWLPSAAFNYLLRSIEILKDFREGTDIWQRLQRYARKHTRNDLVLVEFDTYVRLARAVIAPAGGVACQNIDKN